MTSPEGQARKAREASAALRSVTADQKTTAIRSMAERLRARQEALLSANREDLARAEKNGLGKAKMDRLARSVAHLVEVTKALEAKGAHLSILDFRMDTSTSTGRLMYNVLGAVAQFEREVMLERQREGIAKAKAEGKYKGRKPTARAKAGEVVALRKQGVGAAEIAKRLSIGRASVYRILNEAA